MSTSTLTIGLRQETNAARKQGMVWKWDGVGVGAQDEIDRCAYFNISGGHY